ncbi:PDC sensor domain-containing protein [Endothiovibrio diazotrophicus]
MKWLMAILLINVGAFANAQTQPTEYGPALVRLAADDIEQVFSDIRASTEAVAHEYERLYRSSTSDEPPAPAAGRQLRHTFQLNTWGDVPEPAFQAPQAAYFAYGEGEPTTAQRLQLQNFKTLTPVVRAAYHTFDYSWAYLTSADGAMMIYPFLTLEEAVNNYPPTDQIFYTAADFSGRKAGWTAPYLDLAGAGMMVTVSSPAFNGEQPIGVASHDITLDQLSGRVLQRLAAGSGGIAYLTDADGLLIGVSDPALREELERVNQQAGRAVLHYRTRVEDGTGQVSTRAPWLNRLSERLIGQAGMANGDVLQVRDGEHSASAMRLADTGWWVVITTAEAR